MTTQKPARTDGGAASSADGCAQRFDGPTVYGGLYRIAYYRDARGNPTARRAACGVELRDFDASGQCIHFAYCTLPHGLPRTRDEGD